MIDLVSKHCEPCRIDAPVVTQEEIDEFMPQLPDWNIIEADGMKRLTKSYTFNDFMEAMSFSNRVATIAEVENHHPAILTEWGKVTVTWWSHKLKGLHVNDLIMAAKTDEQLV